MPASYRRALTIPPFLRMLTGHGIATLGQLQLTLAVGVFVLEQTSSGVWVAAAVALGFAPYVLFSGVAGMLADHYRRSSVLRWSIGIRVVTSSFTTAGLILGWPIPLVIALGAVTAVAATPSYPALGAATPQLMADRDLSAANSLATGVENAAWVAGPGLLGLVLLVGAPVAGGGVAATGCFVVALVCLGRTRIPLPERAPQPGSSLVEEALDGVRAIRGDRRIRVPLILAILDNLLYGYLVVALVLLGERAFDADERGIGWLTTAFALGAFASLAVTPRLGGPGRESRVLIIGMVLFAVVAAGAGLAPALPAAVPLVFCAGLLTLIVEVVAVTWIQRLAPQEVMARVFGIYDTLAVGAVALGSGLAGVLSDAVGVEAALVAISAVTLVLTMACLPRLRSVSASHRVPESPEPQDVA